MQSDQSRASWAITQELKFCQAWNLGWKVKYHTHSPSREFSGKSSVKLEKKTKTKQNAPFLGPFCPSISAKVTFVQNYAMSVPR